MSFDLPGTVKGFFTSELIARAAAALGETESGITGALDHIVAAVINNLSAKASSSEGAEAVVSAAKNTNGTGLLNNLGAFFSDGSLLDKGDHLVKMLLGQEAGNAIIDAAASGSGIKSSSAGTLISMAAPATLGVIGQHAESHNLGASGVSVLLSNSKKIINMSTENVENASGASHDPHHGDGHHSDETVTGGVRWVVPLVVLAALAFLAWWLLRGCGKSTGEHEGHEATTATHDDTLTTKKAGADMSMPKITIDSTGMVSYELGKDVEFTLPDGTKFMAAENGFEAQFLRFIKTGAIDSVNKSANWLNMFNVQFKSGGSEYTGKAAEQVKNCGAILKAYPNVTIKLGGYTDNTGPADANKKVSQQRADKVKADLLKMGATAGQITESVGYGPEFPVCAANDTPECKARNRRVACKVASK